MSRETRNDDDFEVEKIEALAEMIYRGGDEPDTKSAALLVLMATFEDSPHPKALANATKHLAFITARNEICAAWSTPRFECFMQSCLQERRSCLNWPSIQNRFPPPTL
ncbi:MAG: hypothetical protein LC794_08050 [Acidobacteria bacterium]|nr:hypothetical protein [Acidobacteriota bacterium]